MGLLAIKLFSSKKNFLALIYPHLVNLVKQYYNITNNKSRKRKRKLAPTFTFGLSMNLIMTDHAQDLGYNEGKRKKLDYKSVCRDLSAYHR